ncbi:hypothetical protein RFI_24793 [Reticulomyxa filosa]|uniref:Uncharacterized protein n=1 Tax=Reticulomyxa filosa TaxID=46433 RepID=X6MEY4_RETFI|nr:hypothetical protein RFI_24793 [Reticulomyxa filosa]|eukprot:ETO12583.1 hypothetical protein RFI_24793 [Reticulomyxa filosa]
MILGEFLDYNILHRMFFEANTLKSRSAVAVYYDEKSPELLDAGKEHKFYFDGIFDRNGKLIRFEVSQAAKKEIWKDLSLQKCTFIYFSWRLRILEHGHEILMDRIQNLPHQYRVAVIWRSGPVTYTYGTEEEATAHFNNIPHYQTAIMMHNDKTTNIRSNEAMCWSICAGHILLEIIDNFYSEELYKGKNSNNYSLSTIMRIA